MQHVSLCDSSKKMHPEGRYRVYMGCPSSAFE